MTSTNNPNTWPDADGEDLTLFTEHLPARRPPASPLRRTPWQAHVRRTDDPLGPADDRLVLPFERREKARQRARLESGLEIGIQLPRGTVLRGGDRLRAASGAMVEVVAAAEPVSTVQSRSLHDLARVAYHLGNRHVALEVGDAWVRYLADHVLDAMVEQLGLAVIRERAPFEPEAGAYAGHSHGARHSHAQPSQPYVYWNRGKP